MTRLAAYAKKKTATYVKKKTKPKKKKIIKKKTYPVTKTEFNRELAVSGYAGKVTPYIRKQINKRVLAKR